MTTRSLARGRDLVLVLVGRVVVRGVRLELRGAGVDGLERRDARRAASRAGADLAGGRRRAGTRAGRPRSPAASRAAARRRRARRAGRRAAGLRLDRRRASRRPPRAGGGTTGRCPVAAASVLDADAAAKQRLELEDAVRRGHRHALEQLVGPSASRGDLGGVRVQPVAALLEGAQRLLQALGEGPADRHHLADGLHPGAEARLGARAASRTASAAPW